MDGSSLDAVVAASPREREQRLHIPHATRVHTLIVDNLRLMVKPLRVSSASDGEEPVPDLHMARGVEAMSSGAALRSVTRHSGKVRR